MSDPVSPGLSSRLSKLNLFKGSRRRNAEDNEDKGEEVDAGTVAGGGHSTRPTDITEHKLRVSEALQLFLDKQGVVSRSDEASLHALLEKPHVSVPQHVTDRSHPLPEYFISSSHNTYLMAHQLFGVSSAGAYETALVAGARCIEIDAWDNPDNHDEPKVTHGYTLVSNIPFRAVCETVRDVVDRERAQAPCDQGYQAAPVVISLENHCDAYGQLRLVDIMKQVWGDRLLAEAINHDMPDEHVPLEKLGSSIVVIVEYHLPNEVDSSSSSSSDDSSDDEEEKKAREDYKAKKKAAGPTIIVPELAALGVYAQSVKPVNNSWYDASTDGTLKDGPHHHLINVSEAGLAAHLSAPHAPDIARHNARHLMRVFPKGTRISSRNLPPVAFWGLGAQICALNWQTFGASMQLNEALFAGTAGYVLKPPVLRADGSGVITSSRHNKILRLQVAGATDLPLPEGRKDDGSDAKPYLTCSLYYPSPTDPSGVVIEKRKTGAYRQHKALSFLHGGDEKNPPQSDPLWDETLEWEFDDTSELVFLRMLIKSDDSFSANPVFAVAAVRLLYVVPGWSFIRMLDLKGRETKCSLLVKFEIGDI
ncbi:PLC-like phosphodiesterase [Podospora didyma]|uniref:Phosphoinositide phospholipase C n=1 Tax=Podospora didyma TaxID=330526 RepID=A0AAE0NUZ9_9PEZI|nr:PLC-like phosphodiesterase [Podospora didyma]